ncbi:MAG: PIN domain-containing protein [Thermodesulfovibrionales bacterium]|nr:PIN domain-containing protein [Thermodesulfovibrionales bacterium]
MHVFIDTNILLNFFHFSKDDLDALNDVFASHEHGSAIVHLTEQVCDEFKRNREVKIKDALKRFTDIKYAAQLPYFMKAYEEYDEIRKLSADLQKKQKSIMEKVISDITGKNLLADRLIGDIFERSKIIKTTTEVFNSASRRMAIGNPPGKNNSIGDAINWIVLLYSVPDNEDLHIISEDGDYYSTLNEESVHPFLSEEWAHKKKSKLYAYRTLSEFMKEHFDGVAFSFDKDKEALIDDLKDAGSFSATHSLVAQLESYSYFSLKEVNRILAAAVGNNQFGYIVTDGDVSAFLNRVAVPHMANISNDEYKTILQSAIDVSKKNVNLE